VSVSQRRLGHSGTAPNELYALQSFNTCNPNSRSSNTQQQQLQQLQQQHAAESPTHSWQNKLSSKLTCPSAVAIPVTGG